MVPVSSFQKVVSHGRTTWGQKTGGAGRKSFNLRYRVPLRRFSEILSLPAGQKSGAAGRIPIFSISLEISCL